MVISIVALAASVAYITQVLDPNDLKPTLVNAAKKHQVQLELKGNIVDVLAMVRYFNGRCAGLIEQLGV